MRPTAHDLWSDFTKIHFLDPPTPIEAEKAARKLYRFAMGKTWTGTVTLHTGNSRSYIDGNNIRVGFSRGWPHMIEDLAWSFVHKANLDAEGGLSGTFKSLEVKMVKEFLKRKWWLGVLKPTPKTKTVVGKDVVRQGKITRLQQRREAWVRKQQRATNAIKKIDRSLKSYERLIRVDGKAKPEQKLIAKESK